jgi:hypothetical protein
LKTKRQQEYFSLLNLTWDVTHANELCEDRKPSGVFKVADAITMLGFIGLEDSDGPVDLNRACIAISYPNFNVIIDGWHRIRDAHANGIEELDVWILSPKDERACRVSPKDNKWKKFDKSLEK